MSPLPLNDLPDEPLPDEDKFGYTNEEMFGIAGHGIHLGLSRLLMMPKGTEYRFDLDSFIFKKLREEHDIHISMGRTEDGYIWVGGSSYGPPDGSSLSHDTLYGGFGNAFNLQDATNALGYALIETINEMQIVFESLDPEDEQAADELSTMDLTGELEEKDEEPDELSDWGINESDLPVEIRNKEITIAISETMNLKELPDELPDDDLFGLDTYGLMDNVNSFLSELLTNIIPDRQAGSESQDFSIIGNYDDPTNITVEVLWDSREIQVVLEVPEEDVREIVYQETRGDFNLFMAVQMVVENWI